MRRELRTGSILSGEQIRRIPKRVEATWSKQHPEDRGLRGDPIGEMTQLRIHSYGRYCQEISSCVHGSLAISRHNLASSINGSLSSADDHKMMTSRTQPPSHHHYHRCLPHRLVLLLLMINLTYHDALKVPPSLNDDLNNVASGDAKCLQQAEYAYRSTLEECADLKPYDMQLIDQIMESDLISAGFKAQGKPPLGGVDEEAGSSTEENEKHADE